MKKVIIPLIVGVLLVLAMLPWLVTGGNPQYLVPNDLQQAPLNFEATVTAAQAATREAGRSATSVIKAFPVGTVPSPIIVTQLASTSEVNIRTISTTTASSDESNPISTIGDLPESSTPIINTSANSNNVPATPIGLIDTEDNITEQQLTEQLRNEPEGSELKDLVVTLSPNGFQIEGILAIPPVSNQHIEIQGEFLIKSYSLVVAISSITLDGNDVTSSYHEEIESRMDTSLYKLLPERYVQNFKVTDGKIFVQSKVRR